MQKCFVRPNNTRLTQSIQQLIESDKVELGYAPWLDEKEILPGQNWEREIRCAIRSSRVFLALLSNRSIDKRGFVQSEMRLALEMLDRFPDNETYLIPVRLENCSPANERLRVLQWVDIFGNFDSEFDKIVRALHVAKIEPRPTTPKPK